MAYLLLLISAISLASANVLDNGGVTLKDPLKMEDIHKEPGCVLKAQDKDVVYWKFMGTFLNTTVFDSGTYESTVGKEFDIIKGIDEGLKGLCVGDKRKLTIHPIWGYGEKETRNIPPNTTTVYEIQLLSIERPTGEIDTLESRVTRTGGVSSDNKLKIVDLFPTGMCKVRADENDIVTWQSHGYLLDGTSFDNGEYKAALGHNIVIKGSDVGVRGLCVGDKRSMTIHYDWGYGAEGIKDRIPPNSTLVFDIVITDIQRTVTTGSSKNETLERTTGLKPEQMLRIEKVHEIENCTLKAAKGDSIIWKYAATLLEGEEFSSGTTKSKLGHGEIVRGCDVGLRGMCIGEKRKLTIHSDWAYGEKGRKGTIPPSSTLVFDVEIIDLMRPPAKVEL